MKLRCAVIEDFQSVATTVVDWSPVTDDIEIVTFTEYLATVDEAAAALDGFDIVVTLRERVPFPAELFARLPRLRLLVASGMRNSVIDFDAARRHGVEVCGTASSSTPPVELTWALLLGLARGIVPEAEALRTGGPSARADRPRGSTARDGQAVEDIRAFLDGQPVRRLG